MVCFIAVTWKKFSKPKALIFCTNLLLEIDTLPLIKGRIQDKVIPIKKFLKDNKLSYKNFKIDQTDIIFNLNDEDSKKLEKIFFSKKDNKVNPFIDQYKTFELNMKKYHYQDY